MRHGLLVFAVLFALGAEPKGDKEMLQGEWVMESLEVEGQAVPEEKLMGATLLIHGDKYLIVTKNNKREASFSLDPTQKIKTIDMVLAEDKNGPKIGKGIYKLEGDVFTMCRALGAETDRPKDFSTMVDSGTFKVTWRRK
jgi:uncharacterized protein (TIGR03067 family)